jgi:hypothetical protein
LSGHGGPHFVWIRLTWGFLLLEGQALKNNFLPP